jgi:hypothetical protein
MTLLVLGLRDKRSWHNLHVGISGFLKVLHEVMADRARAHPGRGGAVVGVALEDEDCVACCAIAGRERQSATPAKVATLRNMESSFCKCGLHRVRRVMLSDVIV